MKRRSRMAAAAGVVALLGVAALTAPAGAADRGSAGSSSAESVAVPPEAVAAVKAAAAAGVENLILDGSSIGIGVIHLHDGVYTHGTYDVVLPAGADTMTAFGWANTAGWFMGDHYCAHVERSTDQGENWTHLPDNYDYGLHVIESNADYIITQYRCT
ncbi:hypothetical protein ABZ901_21655 [Actinacidiphila alni]|uniref:hypothetical protein n=1 Tax=Actinacidiphila alni TaxID=380248 RepID=UPI0033CB6B14